MVIWLRNPQTEGEGLGVGIGDDVLRHERLASIVEIDAGFDAMRRQCDAALDAARAEAQALRDAARAEADALLARAASDYESAAQRGYEDGFARGLADWYARAAESQDDARSLDDATRERLAELVALAVEQIVATHDRQALFARAAAAVERIVADGSAVHLRVHPAEVDDARGAFDEAAREWRDAGRAVRVHVSADAALAPGACVAETDLGSVDASLSLHLAAMRAALERAVQSVAVETSTEAHDATPEAGERDDQNDAHAIAEEPTALAS